MFTGLDKTLTTLTNVLSLSDDVKLNIISKPEPEIRSLTTKTGTHPAIANPNRHDPEVWSGRWCWFETTRLQRSDMSDSNTTIVISTPLHANITNDNHKSITTTEETYVHASGIILVTKHEPWMINDTTVLNSIGLDETNHNNKVWPNVVTTMLTNTIDDKRYHI
ncbi:Riboflavin synthase alpha chain [Candidatus Hodgkinia cicadicola]|nr:Riboflavin synthase alpha chain [Candidatus Hodgkinia cicadicola]